jgi:osmoprotectant transport system permease protein
LALVAWSEQDLSGANALLVEAASLYDAGGSAPGLARALGMQADVARDLGRLDSSLTLHDRRLHVLDVLGRGDLLAVARAERAWLLAGMGRWRDAELQADAAADALRALGLAEQPTVMATPRARSVPQRSLAAYLWSRRASIAALTARHLLLVAVSLAAAILLALPLGLLLERARVSAEPVIRVVGLLQTIPGIALLAFMIPLLGIGVVPALVALFLYSLYPILRNTFTGVRDADPNAVDAARALGMTPGQVLRLVRLPLAAPVIMAGIRTAAVINVGTATLAAFIGAGGLGEPIVSGLALSDTRMILSGAIPAAALALVVDGGLGLVERVVRPGGR